MNGVLLAALVLASPTDDGAKAYAAGDYAKAVTSFEKALAERPDDARRLANLGSALYKAGKYAEAEQRFSQARQHAANDALRAKAAYDQGNARFKQENFDGARDAYDDALRLAPEDADAKANRALAERALQQREQAKQNKNDDQKNDDAQNDKDDAAKDQGEQSAGDEHQDDTEQQKGQQNGQQGQEQAGDNQGEAAAPQSDAKADDSSTKGADQQPAPETAPAQGQDQAAQPSAGEDQRSKSGAASDGEQQHAATPDAKGADGSSGRPKRFKREADGQVMSESDAARILESIDEKRPRSARHRARSRSGKDW